MRRAHLPGTTTDGDPIAAVSCTRPAPAIPSPASRGSGSSPGPYPAASSGNTSELRKALVKMVAEFWLPTGGLRTS